MRRPGRKPTSDTYSVAQVACLLLATSQLWLRAIAGDLSSTRAEAACPVCFGKREVRRRSAHGVVIVSLCPRCKGSATSSEEIADGIAEYLRSSVGDQESLIVAMADLSVAWERVGERTRAAIGEFIKRGPMHFGHEDVEFERSSDRTAVLTMWRSINGFGEFGANAARRKDEDEGPSGARLHVAPARGGHVQRLQAGNPPEHDRAGGETGPLGRRASSLVA